MEENNNVIKQGPDVFISYSSKNKNLADAVVSRFENSGIKCWYAPRDIMPGQEWVSAIKDGLNSAYIFVLIYTEDSNLSRQVMNEVALAFNAGKTLVPFRLTEEMMNDELEYYLTRVHWLDAVSKPLETSIESLYDYISVILKHLKNDGKLPYSEHFHQAKKAMENSADESDNIAIGAGETKKDDGLLNKISEDKRMKFIVGGVGALALILLIVGIVVFVKLSKPVENKPENPDNNISVIDDKSVSGEETVTKSVQKPEEKSNDPTVTPESEPGIEELIEEGYHHYVYGEGREDDKKAIECFEKAAEMGSADAHYYLGQFCELDYDYAAAKQEYEKGISGGSNLAKLGLGYLYNSGLCGEADMEKAWELYNDALENGCVEADYFRALMVLYGFAGQKADSVQAVSLFNNVVESSKMPDFLAASYIELGKIYRRGVLGIHKDYDAAFEAYEKAYSANSSMEGKMIYEYNLGITYNVMGESVKADDHFRKSFQLRKAMSEAGSINATFACAQYYQRGYGMEPDYQEAMKWYKKADAMAKEKNPDSCCPEALVCLGYMYEIGQGCDINYEKAYECYKEAADFGYGEAADSIGNLYLNGYRGKDEEDNRDYNLARQWFEKAIEHGCLDSYVGLGTLYTYGFGVDVDKDKASEYLLKGAEGGSQICMLQLATNYYNDDNYSDTLYWLQILASYDYYYAYHFIGKMYLTGKGVEVDENKGLEMCRVAADAGNKDALEYITYLYYDGNISTGADYAKAFKYAQKGAVLEVPYCMFALGAMYLEGEGTEVNYEKAEKWLLKACEADVDYAMYEYGYIKLYGQEEILPDVKTGDYWLRKLGEKGYFEGYELLISYYINRNETIKYVDCLKEAYDRLGTKVPSGYIYYLAFCYYWGEGIEQDYEKAYSLALVSSDSPQAMVLLGKLYKEGKGTEVDYNESLKWYGRAITSGSLESDEEEACRKAIQDMLDAGMISNEDVEKALNPENNNVPDENGTDQSDDQTMSYEANYKKAYEYQREADKEEINKKALYNKAYEYYYRTDDSTTSDMEIAMAMNELGTRYCSGSWVDQDYEKGLFLIEKAKDSGYLGAYNTLGNMYLIGDGLGENYELAFDCFEKAAEGGDSQGMYNLAYMYENGYGIDAPDLKKAKEYYIKAADLGHALAKRAYERL